MKLHLHWLRFDLRRFRVLLGVWTLLVAAYAVFLGWVHLRFLTISPDILDRSLYIALLLGLLELVFLFALFSADPAKGPRHFWRIRPPSGVAVASSKLVLALGFFVALPLLAWWAVNVLCVLPEYAVTQSPTGLSWTAFLFWIQSLIVSAFALAAACAANKKEFHLRLVISTGIVACGVYILDEIGIWAVEKIWKEPVLLRLSGWLGSGFLTLPMAVLILTAASHHLLSVRRRRLPTGHRLASPMLLPTGAMFIAAAVRTPDSRTSLPFRDEFLPSPDSTAAGKIRVVEMPLYSGGFEEVENYPRHGFSEETVNLLSSPLRQTRFSTSLKVEGLPPGVLVSARWLELRLTTAGGAVVHADIRPDDPEFRVIHQDDPGNLSPSPVSFPKQALHLLPVEPCIAAGTLRLTLYTRNRQRLPLPDGQIHSSPLGPLLMRRTRGDYFIYKEAGYTNTPAPPDGLVLDSPQTEMSFFNFLALDSAGSINNQLLKFYTVWGNDEFPLAANYGDGLPATGFLIQYKPSSFSVSTCRATWDKKREAGARDFGNPDWMQAIYTGRPLPDGWELGIESSHPYAAMNLPVTLHDIVPGIGRDTARLQALSDIHPRKNASPGKVRSDLRHAYALISGMSHHMGKGDSPQVWQQAVSLWQSILDEVPQTYLSILLDLNRDKVWPARYGDQTWPPALYLLDDAKSPTHILYLLRKRTAGLIRPADAPAILSDPDLMGNLRPFLPESAAIPASDNPKR